MRINRFIAACTGLSRRTADAVITAGRATINGQVAAFGQAVLPNDVVKLDGQHLQFKPLQTILLHKPVGYITSREGQGSQTIYDVLPPTLHHLKAVGRLDKDSSGLLLLTNDGELAQQLSHPSNHKVKIYELTLDKPLLPLHRQMVSDKGLQLEDGLSKLTLERQQDADDTLWRVTMHEGRNRQIRRTFAALGYNVVRLHRTRFGDYALGDIPSGKYASVPGAGHIDTPA